MTTTLTTFISARKSQINIEWNFANKFVADFLTIFLQFFVIIFSNYSNNCSWTNNSVAHTNAIDGAIELDTSRHASAFHQAAALFSGQILFEAVIKWGSKQATFDQTWILDLKKKGFCCLFQMFEDQIRSSYYYSI